jgi:NAD(P)-dependent dehydrogenase (short-subunit alcohol dehydrogenase family)
VTVRSEVLDMVGLARTYGEPIDLLVNCAGILKNASLLDLAEEDFTLVLRTDLIGTLLVTQAVAAGLKQARRRGSIVNMTSVSGLLGNLGQANESAAKAGVYGLTRTSAIELQKFGITVNAVAAIARTRLTEDLPMFEKVRGTLEPEHVAPAVVFLASELGEGLSGVVLSVAGGRLSTISLVESQGRLKDEADGRWTPQEIAEHFASIARK